MKADDTSKPEGLANDPVLRRGKTGQVLPTQDNAYEIARAHGAGVLGFDARRQCVVSTGPLPWQQVPGPMEDQHLTSFLVWVGKSYGVDLTPEKAARGLVAAARVLHTFDPVVEYFNALRWDGRSRIEALVHSFKAQADQYSVAVVRRWLISAVARSFDPGCKTDVLLILVGAQGFRKSSWFRVMAGSEHFVDQGLDTKSRDSLLAARRALLWEIPELANMKRECPNNVKAFVSRAVDDIRMPYGRSVVSLPRRFVLCGSTNETTFLRDSSGGRRFWPLKVGMIDLAWTHANRDQLWAEAVAAYRSGEQWWLTEEEEALARVAQEGHRETDPFEDLFDVAITAGRYAHDGRPWATVPMVAEWFGLTQYTRVDARRIRAVLELRGWTTVNDGARPIKFRPTRPLPPRMVIVPN